MSSTSSTPRAGAAPADAMTSKRSLFIHAGPPISCDSWSR
jgi:hypothetical protein